MTARNVGQLLVLLGEASWAGSRSFYEEPYLRHRFGDSDRQYTRAVRRWIPGRRYEQVQSS